MRRQGLGTRFLRDRRGATAVEFALVVPMLFALIFGTIEAGWTMVQTIMLDHALDQTVRALRVGQLPNPTQANVRQTVCDEAMILADCATQLTLEFIVINDAGTNYPADTARCVVRNSPVNPVLRFDPGGRGAPQIVYVRACFAVNPLTPGLALGLALPKDTSGAYRIIAHSGFVNEPE